MDNKKAELSPQLKALQTTDLTFFIGMGSLMVPRMLGVFLPKLNEKQRAAFDKIMPAGGTKKFYMQLVGTPTPPIVMEMAQPLKMSVQSEEEVKKMGIKGIRLTVQDLQPAMEKRIGKFLWQIKGQIGTLLGLSGMMMPLILLGPRELKDLKVKALNHFKPLLDMMPQ
jgi:hypothetical protein